MSKLLVRRLFDGEQWLSQQTVEIEGQQIVSVRQRQEGELDGIEVDKLVPGFIDVHVNGGGGALFNHEPSLASLNTMVQVHAQYGTVAMMPTLISDDFSIMSKAHKVVNLAIDGGMPGILGIHYEGPYLNPVRKGVHNEEKLRSPTEDKVASLLTLPESGKLMVTLAPEQVPADFVSWLVAQGAIVCIGHSAATYEQAMNAVHSGARGFTHLFNAMSGLTSREPGVVGAALQKGQDTWCGLIADGHHVHPAVMKIALAAKGCERVILVTDAIQSVGYEASEMALLGKKVIRHKGKVTTEDGTLAGSDLDMASAVRNAINLIGVDEVSALQMASLRPAEFLGLDHEFGRIKAGYRASLVALDNDLLVQQTWIDGKCVYQAELAEV